MYSSSPATLLWFSSLLGLKMTLSWIGRQSWLLLDRPLLEVWNKITYIITHHWWQGDDVLIIILNSIEVDILQFALETTQVLKCECVQSACTWSYAQINLPHKLNPLSTTGLLTPFLIGPYNELFTCIANYDKTFKMLHTQTCTWD